MRPGSFYLTASTIPLLCLLLFSCGSDTGTVAETAEAVNLDGLQIRRVAQFDFTSYTDAEGDPPLLTIDAYASFEVFDSPLSPAGNPAVREPASLPSRRVCIF